MPPDTPSQNEVPQQSEAQNEAPKQVAAPDSKEGLKAQVKDLRTKGDKLEQALKDAKKNGDSSKEKGDGKTEGKNEQKENGERFKEILKRQLSVRMQKELGINPYTDVSKYPKNELLSKYDRIQKSRGFVSSHTPESLGHILEREVRTSMEELSKERPGDSAAIPELQGDTASPDVLNAQIEYVKQVMIETLDTVQQNLEAEMKKQGIDPKEHFEEAVKKDEAVKHVNPVSNDKGLSAKARNSMRRFRDTIDGARTTDNVTMRDIAHRPPENDTERSAVKQFNALTDRYNEALEHSIESGLPASEKSARAVLLEKYAEDVLKSPLQKDASIPKFADWLKQNIVTADEAKKQEGAKKKV